MDLNEISEDFIKLCQEFEIEPVVRSGFAGQPILFLVGATIPKPEDRKKFDVMLGKNIPYQFMEQVKQSTLAIIQQLVAQVHPTSFRIEGKGRQGRLHISGVTEDHPVFEQINHVLVEDKFFNSWSLFIDGKEIYRVDPKVNAELERNQRDKGITNDDLDHLRIQLGRNLDVNDFLKEV